MSSTSLEKKDETEVEYEELKKRYLQLQKDNEELLLENKQLKAAMKSSDAPLEELPKSGEADDKKDANDSGTMEKGDTAQEEDPKYLEELTEKLAAVAVEKEKPEVDLGDIEPCDDYERFLSQSFSVASVREVLLHLSNVRAAELEHIANNYKMDRLSEGDTIRRLFDVFFSSDPEALRRFEEDAFLQPYSVTPLHPRNGDYAKWSEQFFQNIVVKNYFPELGKVTGDIPRVLSGASTRTMLVHQPPLLVNPCHYETKVEKVVVMKGKKEKVTISETAPVPLFTADELMKTVPVRRWAQLYREQYGKQPTASLLLSQLSPGQTENYEPSTNPFLFGMISEEYTDTLNEYRQLLEQKHTTVQLARKLAPTYIKKMMNELDMSFEPEKMKMLTRMQEEMDDEAVIALNAIYRYHKEKEKFGRLQDGFFLAFYFQ